MECTVQARSQLFTGGGGGFAYFTGPPLEGAMCPSEGVGGGEGAFAIFTLKWSDLMLQFLPKLLSLFARGGWGGGGGYGPAVQLDMSDGPEMKSCISLALPSREFLIDFILKRL